MVLRVPTILTLLLLPVAAAAADLAAYTQDAEAALQRLRGAMMLEMQRAMAAGPASRSRCCAASGPPSATARSPSISCRRSR